MKDADYVMLENTNVGLQGQIESLKQERDRLLEVAQDLRLQINQNEKKRSGVPFSQVSSITQNPGLAYDAPDKPRVSNQAAADLNMLRGEVDMLKSFMKQMRLSRESAPERASYN